MITAYQRMMIDLHVEPRRSKTWEEFQTENQPFSIALDGYVADKPLRDLTKPCVNFNHHEYVDRLSTRSTTAQVHLAIKQGLFDTFNHDGIPAAEVYVNDPDYDVCVAWWLLKNHERITSVKSEPLITKLVTITDFLDTTGGLYPLDPNTRLMRKRAWIFEPYTNARLAGRVPLMGVSEMRDVIDAVIERIDEYTIGKGKERTVDTRYETIGGGDGWVMVREIGAEARGKMIADGIKAFVSVRNVGDTLWAYTFARTSQFVPLPVLGIIEHVNMLEGYAPGDPAAGGGSDIIGATSRKNYCTIPPPELERIVNRFMIANLSHKK